MEFHNTEIWRHSSELSIHENASRHDKPNFLHGCFQNFKQNTIIGLRASIEMSRLLLKGIFIHYKTKEQEDTSSCTTDPCKICAAAGSFPSFYLSYLAASCAKIIQICSKLHQIQNKISRGRGCPWKSSAAKQPKKDHMNCRAVVGGRVAVIAGPNVFIASVKRPETPNKSNKHTKKPTERGSSLLLCVAALFSVNF